MGTRARYRLIRGQVASMAIAAVVLSWLSALTYDVFFVVSLVSFLVLMEVTSPVNVTPRWRTRLRWLVLLGLLLFATVVVRRVLSFLPSGLL